MKFIIVLILVMVLIVALPAGCSKFQYGSAEMVWVGDNDTQDLYVEHFAGEMSIIVDPNTNWTTYELADANSTYTRLSVGSSVSEGRLPALAELVPAIVEILIKEGLISVPE